MSVFLELLGELFGELIVDPMIELGKSVFRRGQSGRERELAEPMRVYESATERAEPHFNEHPYLPGRSE